MSVQKAIEIVKSSKTNISTKTRALFYLRCLDTAEAALALQKCISNTSVLLDHEIAYILGQMKQSVSIPFLFDLVENKQNNDIVRHEAIEALGNFEDSSLISKLEKYLEDENPIVSESAILAIRKLNETNRNASSNINTNEDDIHIKDINNHIENSNNEYAEINGEMSGFSKYHSRDPASPFRGTFEEAIEAFNSNSIEDKYKAIFYFRDLNTKESVDILMKGFKEPSDLLRHEIAYVFGQMENPLATEGLIEVLEDGNESNIVRHEAAEALGNIGTERALRCLEKYLHSEIDILRESANVGLGILNNDEDDYVNIDMVFDQ